MIMSDDDKIFEMSFDFESKIEVIKRSGVAEKKGWEGCCFDICWEKN